MSPMLKGGQGRPDSDIADSAWWFLRLLVLCVVLVLLLASCPGGRQ